MVAYSFQHQFCEPIDAGTKGGTIRANMRKRHAREGDSLQLYFGMRTRACRLVKRTVCLGSWPIWLCFDGVGQGVVVTPAPDVQHCINGSDELQAFARFDGFEDWRHLIAFWAETHGPGKEFQGRHIRWLDWPAELRERLG